jgi:hypothetical protein
VSLASDALTAVEHLVKTFAALQKIDGDAELQARERMDVREAVTEEIQRALKPYMQLLRMIAHFAPKAPEAPCGPLAACSSTSPQAWPGEPRSRRADSTSSRSSAVGRELAGFFLEIAPPMERDILDHFLDFVRTVGTRRCRSSPSSCTFEPPERFLDATLYLLMRNPVKLPKVKDNPQTRVDRSTLPYLSCCNPLLATPFREDDLELKAEIDAWWAHYVREYREAQARKQT